MLKNKEDIKYIACPKLEAYAATSHAFLTRTGGTSGGVFSSLNFDLRDGDNESNVKYNKTKAAKVFGFNPLNLITVNQVHGDNIFIIDKKTPLSKKVSADAIITNLKGIAIAVLTADCVPIILLDPLNTAIAIVHAGWKGTLKKIAQKTILSMSEKFGTSVETLVAAIGPCIGECCYNVAESVVKLFKNTFPDYKEFIKLEKSDWKLDLKRANYIQLVCAGLLKKNIWTANHCTSCRKDLFFSYRRDNKKTGRQMSFVMINK
ncbi:MAG: peptidoglycan editing factor PgeF [Deltaproteobacteria bacterium]|nr:peptidoglycan editing factor PgeF [Deltaproteobacteria bacterium]